MKKILLLIASFALVSIAPAHAAGHAYGVAGCGLGNLAFGHDTQILAATTNASFYTQMFGITSGTSNCTDDGTTRSSMVVPQFIEANRLALANDIARGSGETLVNLSAVLGCSDSAQLGASLQKNYHTIFPTQQTETGAVTNSIIGVVKSDSQLSAACKNVG